MIVIYPKDSNTRDLHPVDEETEDGSFLTGFKTFLSRNKYCRFLAG